jgi:hypothetical protein
MLATVVDVHALRDVVLASLAAGIGVSASFALAIAGATFFSEMQREERLGATLFSGLVAFLGLAVFAGAVVVGLIVMTSK